jgi:transposase
MTRLTEKKTYRIMMVGYGDKLRSHEEACALFNEVHFEIPPIARSTVSRIVAKFNETGSVRDIPRSGRPRISDDTKLNLLLSLEDNPHASTTEMALQENVSQWFVVKLLKKALKKEKLHPYKVQLVHELSEDNLDRRFEFCEILMRRKSKFFK